MAITLSWKKWVSWGSEMAKGSTHVTGVIGETRTCRSGYHDRLFQCLQVFVSLPHGKSYILTPITSDWGVWSFEA